jgi:hypothetical protein
LTDLTSLISSAVSAKMTPEFVEKEVNTRVEKLIVESIDRALRSYSDTGKLIEKAIDDALRVERLDLPSYGNVVAGMLKVQIEAKVAPLVAGQLAADMDELLNLAPKEIKLSEIAAEMRKRHEGEGYGEVITVMVEHNAYGSINVYLDEDEAHAARDMHKSEVRLHIGTDGKILGATMRGRDFKATNDIGRSYGLSQKIRAYFACGTTIILDEDAVSTSVGDY